jgi:hypothetical protein
MAATRKRQGFIIARFADNPDNAGHLRGVFSVYQALTAMGKDCGDIGKKHQRASGATKAGPHSHQLQ